MSIQIERRPVHVLYRTRSGCERDGLGRHHPPGTSYMETAAGGTSDRAEYIITVDKR
jgi:hypothetical protein